MIKAMFLFDAINDISLDVSREEEFRFESFESMEASINQVLPVSSKSPEEWAIRRFDCSRFKPVTYKVQGRVVQEQMESQVCVEVINNSTNEIVEYRLDVATKSRQAMDSASRHSYYSGMARRFGVFPSINKTINCSVDQIPEFVI